MKRSTLGIVLIFLGVIFFLHNIDFLPNVVNYYVFSWKSLLIVIGLILLASGQSKQAFILIAIGVIFWIKDIVNLDTQYFWPLFLLLLGVYFLFRSRASSKRNLSQDELDENITFAGVNSRIQNTHFKGGQINVLFGGYELDMREVNLANDVSLDVSVMFGGIKLYIPNEWNVNLQASSIFGGCKDERRSTTPKTSQQYPTLNIKGNVIFGGIEIKN